ncbi:MAG: hypothetical protein ACM3PE_03095 [Deltaproteobacteria bacterium]
MTELQKWFLSNVFLFYLLKAGFYVALWVALVAAERYARLRHEKIKQYLRKKRAEEKVRWEVAYRLYDSKNELPAQQGPMALSQLINNPNSFTAYSYVKNL